MRPKFDAKCEPQANGCIYWTGALDGRGYGLFRLSRNRIERAHRIALRDSGVPVETGDVVMHSCDTPRCVNPEHLSVGTIDDNMADRNAKGRQARGATHAFAVLTEADVVVIRNSDEHPNILARRFGVTPPTIYNVIARRIWRHV